MIEKIERGFKKYKNKVIEAKDSLSKEFKQPVEMIQAKKDLPVFDIGLALASVEKSELYGWTKEFKQVK